MPGTDFVDEEERNDAWIQDVEQRVKRALVSLSEHADAVQVFVTRDTGEHTLTYQKGRGNWNARMNMARTWVAVEDSDRCTEEP